MHKVQNILNQLRTLSHHSTKNVSNTSSLSVPLLYPPPYFCTFLTELLCTYIHTAPAVPAVNNKNKKKPSSDCINIVQAQNRSFIFVSTRFHTSADQRDELDLQMQLKQPYK